MDPQLKNTDVVVAIDDNAVVNISRLFNEETGRAYLVEKGVPEATLDQLGLAWLLWHLERVLLHQGRQIL